MSSTINATTVGVGGVVTTADNSGILVLQTASTDAVTISAAQGVTLAGTLGVTGATTLSSTLAVTGITTIAAGTALLPSIISTTGTADTGMWFPAADTVAWSTAGTERMRIISTGNVGIGTTVPRKGFSINAGFAFQAPAGANRGINWGDETTDIFPMSVGADTRAGSENMSFSTNTFGNAATERMRITSGGYVGIATTAPSVVLEIAHNGGSTFGTALQIKTLSGTDGPRAAFEYYNGGTPKRWNIGIRNSSTTFGIFEDGYAGSFGTERLGIAADVVLMGAATLLTITTGGSANAFAMQESTGYMFKSVTTTAAYGQILFYNPNGQVGQIYTNGSSTVYATSSDYRRKNSIIPMTGALDKVSLLKPVTYKWNVDGSDGQGFIAHELAEVCPIAVYGEKDAVDDDNNPQYQSIDTSFLVATLTAAIQELKAIIDTQATRITALETA